MTSKKDDDDYDPYAERELAAPTSNFDTLTHLLKSALGSGILVMPAAFKSSGLVFGIFVTAVVGLITINCAETVVRCSHALLPQLKVPSMTFPELGEAAFLKGPKCAVKCAGAIKSFIVFFIFLSYYTMVSAYTVIVARNILYVTDHYYGEDSFNVRYVIALLLIPLMILAYIPNLKQLSPVSTVANLCMFAGLAISFYYCCRGLDSISKRNMITDDIATLPISVSVAIFAMSCIGVIMPLENNMRTPEAMTGVFGIVSQGLSFATLCLIIMGFFGYWRYGEATEHSITYSLPKEPAAQAVNILVAIAVFLTSGLQFYVCLEIAWNYLKHRYTKRPLLANYILRTVLIVSANMIAVALPTIVPFLGLLGAFCFTTIGLKVPIFIKICTFWEKGFGFCYWILLKDFIIILTSFTALIFGSKSSIEEIALLFK